MRQLVFETTINLAVLNEMKPFVLWLISRLLKKLVLTIWQFSSFMEREILRSPYLDICTDVLKSQFKYGQKMQTYTSQDTQFDSLSLLIFLIPTLLCAGKVNFMKGGWWPYEGFTYFSLPHALWLLYLQFHQKHCPLQLTSLVLSFVTILITFSFFIFCSFSLELWSKLLLVSTLPGWLGVPLDSPTPGKQWLLDTCL